MAKAGDKGIPLEDYLKTHPEILVRNQLDRGELRYAWTDPDGNARASDDGRPVPPRGWWPRPEFTWIDRERRVVRGHALFPPRFPPMYFVEVFPAVTPADKRPAQNAPRRGRPSSAPLVVAEAIARLQGNDRAGIERRGREQFLEELRIWLGEAHPEARSMASKTIGDRLHDDEKVQAVWPKTWRRRRR